MKTNTLKKLLSGLPVENVRTSAYADGTTFAKIRFSVGGRRARGPFCNGARVCARLSELGARSISLDFANVAICIFP